MRHHITWYLYRCKVSFTSHRARFYRRKQ